MLEVRHRLYQNPWPDTIPTPALADIIKQVAEGRAEHVEQQFGLGNYPRNSFGLAILDPSAPLWTPSLYTVLATIAIGGEGDQFVVNGVAKAVEHRDHGHLAGNGVYIDLTQSMDGDFCYGYSSQVDGTIGGGSAQTELQDAFEVGLALVEFNYLVRLARKEWQKANPKAHWFSRDDQPHKQYVDAANQPTVVFDSKFDIETSVS